MLLVFLRRTVLFLMIHFKSWIGFHRSPSSCQLLKTANHVGVVEEMLSRALIYFCIVVLASLFSWFVGCLIKGIMALATCK